MLLSDLWESKTSVPRMSVSAGDNGPVCLSAASTQQHNSVALSRPSQSQEIITATVSVLMFSQGRPLGPYLDLDLC